MRTIVITVLLMGSGTGCMQPQAPTPDGFVTDMESFMGRVKNGYLERPAEEWTAMDGERDALMETKYSEVEDQLRPEQRVKIERLTSEYEVYHTAAQILQPIREFNELDHDAVVAEVDAFVGSLDEVSTDGIRTISKALPQLQEDLHAVRGSIEPLTLKLDSLLRTAGGNAHQ